MLPALILSDTEARVARVRAGDDRPRPAASQQRMLGIGSAFLPAPAVIEFRGVALVLANELLEDGAATLLAQAHPTARPKLDSFLYVYTAEEGSALVVVVDQATHSIFSITESTVNRYYEFGSSNLLGSTPMRNELEASRGVYQQRIEDLQAEMDAQKEALDGVRQELHTMPTFKTVVDAAVARFQRDPEPPRAIFPTIRKKERPVPPNQPPPSPVPSNSTDPIIADMSDED